MSYKSYSVIKVLKSKTIIIIIIIIKMALLHHKCSTV